jgi:iron(II)-dependent oxidoreductase
MFARSPLEAAGTRQLAGVALAEALRDSRRRTLSLVGDLSDEQWRVPNKPGINPVAWELAHLAWFGEFWILRGPHADEHGLIHAARSARIAGPDSLFDSARLAHAQRWQIPLPTRAQVLDTLARQLEACLDAMPEQDSDESLYFHRLTLFHEDMHGEALVWMRAALGFSAPAALSLKAQGTTCRIQLPGGAASLGWPMGQRGFAFDNELPGSMLEVQAYDIDMGVVTAGQFQQFVAAGGYETPSLWPEASQPWRDAVRPAHPSRWRRTSQGAWQQRCFDQWMVVDPALPMIHINAFEAEAYCEWVGRRLPLAAEWEYAATTADGFLWGNSVWEWTADPFLPYEGFVPGPYKDYSQSWFDNHRELRGGAFATHPRMHLHAYRNFFTPERSDIFAGFRTASRR